ncbi:MAG: carbamate kinase [Bacilli bacterium]|nr:carbamate kinase [Bacilli bacterium]
MSKIVIALGGNALGTNPSDQLTKLEKVAKIIVNLIKEGNQVVLTHGNGPQVGQIALAMEYSAVGEVKTPFMPFAECGSMSQGYIGYQLQQALQDEMERQGVKKDCVTVITQVLVDANDEAFKNPTKPIGAFYTEEEALKIEKEKGYKFVSDAGRGYRRVVPSPIPKDIIEKRVIEKLVSNDVVVIAVGGGGIPVIKTDKLKLLEGIEAVIDKDLSSALLAKEINADILLILTSIDKVYLNFNTPNQIGLDEITIEEAKKYILNKEFASGSMLPKIKACLNFVENSNNKAIITSLEQADKAFLSNVGTKIIGGK